MTGGGLRDALGMARSLAIYYGRPWRMRRLRRFYAEFVQPGDLCFDIGANVGDRSYCWTQLGARVVALEPQPRFAAMCRRVLRGRPVTVLEAAVGAAPGVLELMISRRHPTLSTMSSSFRAAVQDAASFQAVTWDEAISVEVLTLDQLIARHGEPAFVKIDVEGFEAEVLQGLSRPLRALSFEYLVATMPVARACVARLAALGRYRYRLSPGESQRFETAEWLPAEALLARLDQLAEAEAGSGDIYARLIA